MIFARAEIARAMAIRNDGRKRALPAEVDELVVTLAGWVDEALAPFAGVDRSAAGYEQLLAAQERLASPEQRVSFAEAFLRAEGLFEFLWPTESLRRIEPDYRWLAKVYASLQPGADPNALLWHRLGSKTAELLASYVSDFTVDAAALEAIAIDAETFGALQQLDLFPGGAVGGVPPSVDAVLDTLEARLPRKLAGPAVHPIWRTLAERLEELRRARLAGARDSVEFLKRLLEAARSWAPSGPRPRAGSIASRSSIPTGAP